MDLFRFYDKYGMKFRCPDIYVIYTLPIAFPLKVAYLEIQSPTVCLYGLGPDIEENYLQILTRFASKTADVIHQL